MVMQHLSSRFEERRILDLPRRSFRAQAGNGFQHISER